MGAVWLGKHLPSELSLLSDEALSVFVSSLHSFSKHMGQSLIPKPQLRRFSACSKVIFQMYFTIFEHNIVSLPPPPPPNTSNELACGVSILSADLLQNVSRIQSYCGEELG
jgi:hypothetical protein